MKRINASIDLFARVDYYCIVDMAVFMLNICKFNGCGLTFKSLGDLIQHIEETHIGNYFNSNFQSRYMLGLRLCTFVLRLSRVLQLRKLPHLFVIYFDIKS